MAAHSHRYQRLIVLQPEYFEKLKKTVAQEDLSSLDKIMNKIMNTKNMDSLSKWNLYKQALLMYTLKNKVKPAVKHKEVVKEPEKKVSPLKVDPTPPRKKIKTPIKSPEKVPYINFPKTDDLFTRRRETDPELSIETESEDEKEHHQSERNQRKRFNEDLEAYLHEQAQRAAGQSDPKQIVRRTSSLNSNFRVFDDNESGSVMHVDVDGAAKDLFDRSDLMEYSEFNNPPVTSSSTPRGRKSQSFKDKRQNYMELRTRALRRPRESHTRGLFNSDEKRRTIKKPPLPEPVEKFMKDWEGVFY